MDAGSSECPNGGVALATGDGGFAYVCTGATGPAGATGATGAAGTSVVGSSEQAGSNCAYGGSKFVTGTDVTYACNGAPGTPGSPGQDGVSVVASSEPVGVACPAGGSKFVTGTTVTYACNGSDASLTPGAGINITNGQVSAAFTTAGGDDGNATTVARGDHTHDARYQAKLVTTIVISPTGTPVQNGTALLSAINSITDNSVSKRYLIKLEPGIYDFNGSWYLGKPYVDLEGSGRAVTQIQSASGNSVVNMAAPSEIREVTVAHLGGTANSSALWFSVGSAGQTAARRIALSAAGGTTGTMGTWLGGTGEAVFDDVDITVAGGSSASTYGVRADDPNTQLTARNVRATVSASSGTVRGLYVAGALATLGDVTVSGSNGAGDCYDLALFGSGANVLRSSLSCTSVNGSAYGVYSTSSPTTVDGVTAKTSSNIGAWGMFFSSGTVTVRRATLSASSSSTTYSVFGAQASSVTNLTIEDSSLVSNGGGAAYGLYLANSNAIVRGTLAQASSTSTPIGVSFGASNASTFTLRFDQGRAIHGGGGSGFGLYVFNTGGAATLSTSIAGSQVSGATSPPTGETRHCINDWGSSDQALNSSCQ